MYKRQLYIQASGTRRKQGHGITRKDAHTGAETPVNNIKTTGTIFHDILQEIRTDMTLIVDVGNEMFQFIFSCIISKKTIAIGRNPDDSAGIMYDMITFEVNVTDLVLR